MGVTEKLRRKLITNYEATRSILKAGKRCGIGKQLARRVLIEAGVQLDGLEQHYRRVRKLPDYQALKLEYEAGVSLNALAAKYGTTVRTVHGALGRLGTKFRRRGGIIRELTAEEIAEIPKLYELLKTQAAVAAHMQINQSLVSKLLRRVGVVSKDRPSGSRHGSWKGGVSRNQGGYLLRLLTADDALHSMANVSGYVLEHRLVMARRLGRVLSRDETVHHINGNKADNRIENLQLRQGRHGNGVVHRCKECGCTNIESVKLN